MDWEADLIENSSRLVELKEEHANSSARRKELNARILELETKVVQITH
jgi:hypothetical protein